MRLLAAVRLSRETTSPERERERQRRAIAHAARARADTIVHVAEDLEVSGSVSVWDRDLAPWLTEPERVGMWDALIVAGFDRLTWSLLDFQHLLDWCDKHGKTIISVAEGFDLSTDTGRLIANVLAMFAEFERKRIGERRRDRARADQAKGYWAGGRVIYGKKRVRVGDHFEVIEDPERKPVVERIAREILAGKSATRICRELTAEGVPTGVRRKAKDGEPEPEQPTWHAAVLLDILRSPGGVLDTGTWAALQPVINATSKPHASRYGAAALAGVAFCGQCGAQLWGCHNTFNGRVYAYYRCAAHCGMKMIPAALLEATADDAVTGSYGGYKHFDHRLIPGNDGDQRRQALKRQASRLDIEDRDYDAAVAAIKAELATIKPEPDRYEPVDSGQTVAGHWATLTAAAKRQYLTARGWRFLATAQNHRKGELPIVVVAGAEPEADITVESL